MKAISIRSLRKTYANGTVALKGVDLDVEAGDFFALMGANGAGKTTIIGILTGLVNKTEGAASIYGHDIGSESMQTKSLTGVVPQEMNFNMFEKVIDIVTTQAGYHGINREEALVEAEHLLKQLDLWEKRNQPSRNLSGGMKRRLMIVRALINKPKLLILDEPTAGVDVELRQSMWTFLTDLNRKGTTILLTTHYLEEVEQLCNKAAMIKDGVIIHNDTVKNLVKLVDQETYVVHVAQVRNLEKLDAYRPKKIDEHTVEVDIPKTETMNTFITRLTGSGMELVDLRTKGNRIEKLFLNILKEKSPVKHAS